MQLLGSGDTDLAPTGAATALFGGPLLLWMLRRVSRTCPPQVMFAPSRARRLAPALADAVARRRGHHWRVAAHWRWFSGADPTAGASRPAALLADLLPFRAPRVDRRPCAAGAMLGAAGTLMQRLTGNPLAGPEVLGVSAGGGVGLALVLYLLPATRTR